MGDVSACVGAADWRWVALACERRGRGACDHGDMRRSIDDEPFSADRMPPGWEEDELQPVGWAVAIADDYQDAEPRIVLTVEEQARAGYGLIAHLGPDSVRRLRSALRDAMVELGENPGS